MAIASGIYKELRIARESVFGTLSSEDGQILRRVTSDLDLSKNTYESSEIVAHQQVNDFRHGTRRVEGSINGELSPGTYRLPLEGLLRKNFATGATFTAGTGTEITTTTSTIVRASGSWITDGFKVGDVVRMTNHSTSANNAKNLRVTALTATVMTVAESLTLDSAPDDACTVAVVGSKLWIPASGHTNDSFTIEHWFTDIAQSERFAGCRPNTADIGLPATGLATINMAWLGQKKTTDTSAYFSSPDPATSTGIFSAVQGTLRIGGEDVAVVTGLTLNIAGNRSVGEVVGSDLTPDVFAGRLRVGGQATVYFEDQTFGDYFMNETEISIVMKLNATSADNTDFMSFHLPRIKFGGASKDDGEKGLIQTLPFQALYYASGGSGTAYDQSSIIIQDSTIAS